MSLHSFDDIDDLFTQMRQDQLAADRSVQPWQPDIKPGDYVCRPGPGFHIFSEILPDPEPRAQGLEHYRFTRSYSVACENGELGDIHVSTIEGKLSEAEFQTAREHRWNYEPAEILLGTVEQLRKERFAEINVEPGSREYLECKYEQVWDTKELSKDFDTLGFLAPYVAVVRKSDGIQGSLEFQHNPRFYFNFEANE